MIIGINLVFLYEITGIGVYVRNLLENFGKIDEEDKFVIFVNKKAPSEIFFNFPNFYYFKIPIDPQNYLLRIFCEQIILPFLSLKYKIDVLFTPAVFSPYFCFCKKVTTIHDILYLNDKRLNLKNLYLKFITSAAIRSDKIITISNFAKNDILEKFNIKNKISVIYEAAKIFILKNHKNTIEKFNIKNPYFFYIGLIVPHKNIERMLRAFKIFSEKYKDINFILAGPERKKLLDLDLLIKNLSLRERVKYLGIVNEEEKFALYHNALAFIFLSLHEGFGLPILEAQSSGVPVLASNLTAIPEIAGNSVLYVDPYDIEDIVRGMEKIAFDEKLREDLIKKGYENIKRFSWERAAKETLRVLKEVYENSSNK